MRMMLLLFSAGQRPLVDERLRRFSVLEYLRSWHRLSLGLYSFKRPMSNHLVGYARGGLRRGVRYIPEPKIRYIPDGERMQVGYTLMERE